MFLNVIRRAVQHRNTFGEVKVRGKEVFVESIVHSVECEPQKTQIRQVSPRSGQTAARRPKGAAKDVKTILLMRHAQAASESPGQTDFDRVLTVEGRETSLQTGRSLAIAGIRVDRVLVSAAARTSETAAIVASVVGPQAVTIRLPELYNAPTFSIEAVIRTQLCDDDSCVLVVGHNPGIAGVMCRWSGQSLSVPPATLTMFRASPNNTWCRPGNHEEPRLVMTGILQGGEFVWKEPLEDCVQTPDG